MKREMQGFVSEPYFYDNTVFYNENLDNGYWLAEGRDLQTAYIDGAPKRGLPEKYNGDVPSNIGVTKTRDMRGY